MVRQGPDDARPTDAAQGHGSARGRRVPTVAVAAAMLLAETGAALLVVERVSNRQLLPDLVSGSTWLRYSTMHWILPLTWVAMLFVVGAYRTARAPRLGTQLTRVARAAVGMLALLSAVGLITKLDFSRGLLAWSMLWFVAVAALLRVIAGVGIQLLHRGGRFNERVVLVGVEEDTAPIATHLRRRRESGYSIVGTVSPPSGWADRVEGPDAGMDDVLGAVAAHDATAVIIAGTQMFGPGGARRIAARLTGLGIDVLIAPEIDDFGGPGVVPQPVADLVLLRARAARLSAGERTAKWLLDRAGSVVLIVASLPVMLVIAVGIRLGSKGPIIFRQERVGREGRTFRILKFRTMVADAEERLHLDGLYDEYVANGFKLPPDRDTRITRFGRFLRRTSLDELPQLFNVLAGTMSLVGPRPVITDELADYGEYRDAYLELLPGMTGYWQINGRSDIGFPERAELDAFYASNRSFRFDVLILSRTITAVIRRDGAH